MPNKHVMIFTNSQKRTEIKGLKKIDKEVNLHTLIRDTNQTEEALLRRSYETHEKRLFTTFQDDQGNTVTDTLKGFTFPIKEIRSVIENSADVIEHVYLEFCHHGELSGKDEFSIMITGLNGKYERVKEEKGESRVYEFAQSCPNRCPKEESFPLT